MGRTGSETPLKYLRHLRINRLRAGELVNGELKYMNKKTDNGAWEAFAAQVHDLRVIALDCDGVLFDSREANIHFYSHIMKIIGGPPVRTDQQEFIHMH